MYMPKLRAPVLTRPLLLALAYFVTGWLGLQISYTGTHITLVWLPTGIAVAALLRWGWTVWPGIWLGAFLVNLSIGSSLSLAAGIAIGNTLGPLVTLGWLKRVDFHSALDRQKDVGLFIAAASMGMTVSALGGTMSLNLAGLIPLESTGIAALSWWMGDTVGVLLAAPLLLTLTWKNIEQLRQGGKEVLLWTLVAAPVAWFAFMQDLHPMGRSLPLAFLTLPFFAWAALRFGNTGAALAGLGFSATAAWYTATGHGPFFLSDIHVGLFLLWAYIATIVLTGLMITALQAERLQVENTLRESEEKLRGLYELSPLGIALADMNGRYVEFNDAFKNICGYPGEELKVLDYWALTPRKYEAEELRQLESLERTGRYGPYEKEYVRKDGSLVPLRLNGILITRKDGQKYIWSIVEDITQKKQAEMSMRDQAEHTQTILDNIVDGIITIDSTGMIASFNPAAEHIFGYAPEEVLGRSVRMLMSDSHRDAHDGNLHDFQTTGVENIVGIDREAEGQRKDGSLFPMEWAISEISRQGHKMYVGMVRDITERKQVERMKNEFVSTVSHELRTPLTSISGALGLIAGGALGEIPVRLQNMIEVAHKNSQRLTYLINDLLDMEKLVAGKMHFDMQPQPLMPIVEQALEAHRTYSVERRVTLALTGAVPDAEVQVDSQRLMQVLANLLSNAIKYSPEDGTVEVAVESTGNSIRVTVSDHGPGIPALFHTRIFQKFSQADSSDTRQKGGTGLGLAITRELVERMGGHVGFESEEGKGARFYIEFLTVSARGQNGAVT